MATSDAYKKYIEAGAVLTKITKARAEEIVKDLVGSGDLKLENAQKWVDDLVERSKTSSEEIIEFIRKEVARQIASLSLDPDQLAEHAAKFLHASAEKGKDLTRKAAQRASGAAGSATRAGKKAVEEGAGTVNAARHAASKVANKAAKVGKKKKHKGSGKKDHEAGPKAEAGKKVAAKKVAPKKVAQKKTNARQTETKKLAAKKPASKTAIAKKTTKSPSTKLKT